MIFSHYNFLNNLPSSINIDFNNFHGPIRDDLITPIEFVNLSPKPVIKFLGVLFDPTLNFKSQIDVISSKISKSLYVIRKAKNLLTPKALKALYYSLIHSHLIYCTHIWSSGSLSAIKTLVNKQKMAIRLIHNAVYNAHTESLFKKSEVLPLHMLIDYFRIQFMHQFVYNHLPASFSRCWLTNAERRDDGPALRNEEDFFVPISRLTSTDRHPLVVIPKTWNEFNAPELKSTSQKNVFNKSLKKFLIDTLDSDFKCTRLLCPHCHL
jgi:hypothetical protein